MPTSACSRRVYVAGQRAQSTSSLYWRRCQSSSSVAPSSRPRSRVRDQQNRSDTSLDQVDLVGPPDPISNIRPMYYAPVPSSSSSQHPSNTSRSTRPLPHPYSLSEFSQVSRASKRGSRAGLGVFEGYRNLVDRVTGRVEEAEMKLRVSKMGTDNVTQRFWKDNNTRFTRDLEQWREESYRRVAALPEDFKSDAVSSNIQPSSVVAQKSAQAVNEMSKDESAFYANWLRANGRRNRAYNVLVWKQAWDQVHLDARVVVLRNWLKTLLWLRGR